nr:DUF1015 family protein [uncultured Peptostreptococcus sp.]
MVTLRPFKALRPHKKYVDRVAALPYDTMNTEEARIMAKDNPYNYLRIDRAEIDLDPQIDIHDPRVYEKAGQNLRDFIDKGIFIQEDEPSLYIYRETMDGRVQVGIVGCLAVDESLDGIIKKHEHTKPDKVEDRTRHIEACQANTGTILVTYRNDTIVDAIIADQMTQVPLYDFISEDGVGHTVWKLDVQAREGLVKAFEGLDNLYVADGHHRTAAAENYAKKMREKNTNYTGQEEFNYYLAMIAPENNLYIMDYNRVLTDLNGHSLEEYLDLVGKIFHIEAVGQAYKPEKKYQYGMYINDQWYKLDVREEVVAEIREKSKNTAIDLLDVSLLHDLLIEPILGIDVPQKDKRIDFIGGIRGLEEIEKRVDQDMKLGFALYPTAIEELMAVADMDGVMPAKSTWFEPKVRCGIFLHMMD